MVPRASHRPGLRDQFGGVEAAVGIVGVVSWGFRPVTRRPTWRCPTTSGLSSAYQTSPGGGNAMQTLRVNPVTSIGNLWHIACRPKASYPATPTRAPDAVLRRNDSATFTRSSPRLKRCRGLIFTPTLLTISTAMPRRIIETRAQRSLDHAPQSGAQDQRHRGFTDRLPDRGGLQA